MIDKNKLSGYYYVKNQRIEMMKTDLKNYVNVYPKFVTNHGELVSFFCDIHYPYVDENQQVMIKLCLDEQKLIDLPLKHIKKIYRAGWPRAGKMAERFTVFPWKLLKPIDDFIRHPKDVDKLINSLLKEKVYDNSYVTTAYETHLLPWIHDKNHRFLKVNSKSYINWFNVLNDRYREIVDTHKKIMLEAYSVLVGGYPYTGVITSKALINEEDDNPFRAYLTTCVKHQEDILENEESKS